jgi:hypothetical protein
MNGRSVPTQSGGPTTCVICGKWPATLYVDYKNKNAGGRICEDCAPKYERNEQGRLIIK